MTGDLVVHRAVSDILDTSIVHLHSALDHHHPPLEVVTKAAVPSAVAAVNTGPD